MYEGKVHDFTIFKEMFTNIDFSSLNVYVDLGFLGIKKIIKYGNLYIPHKTSKNHKLTDDEKLENHNLSSIRVAVENAIAKFKSFFVVRIENRMKIKLKLDDAFDICVSLTNFKIKNHK